MSILDIIMRRQTTKQQPTIDINKTLARVTGVKTGWQWGLTRFNQDLTNADKKKAYFNNPIIFKGINKKARDIIYNGFEIDSPIDGVDVPENIENDIQAFLTEKQIIKKIHHAIIDSLWQGNGYIEWVCAGNKEPEQPLNGKLLDIVYVDTETITGYELNEYGDVEFWKQRIKGKTIKIHTSRLEHIGFYPNGNNPFCISPIEIANRAIKADNDATKSLGDNLDLFGHPFPVINTTDNNNTKQVEDAFNVLKQLGKGKLKVGFAGFKDTKFDLLNPQSPNPQYALQHFYIELAAALEMPMLLLTGSQMSKLTGNEIELNDYYKSIKAIQDIHISPVFHKMFNLLLGDGWKYEIYWNPLYVDEKSEIENKTKIMKEIGELYAKHSVIDVIEARQLLREHGVGIPENNPMDEPEEPVPSEDMQPIQENEEYMTARQPTEEELKIAEELRKLGEKELKEQEKRLRNAYKVRKSKKTVRGK